tara:strand:+ start:13934 stop:15658 length:1725 start_codon:yes stop_codon:yes gene_type:complete
MFDILKINKSTNYRQNKFIENFDSNVNLRSFNGKLLSLFEEATSQNYFHYVNSLIMHNYFYTDGDINAINIGLLSNFKNDFLSKFYEFKKTFIHTKSKFIFFNAEGEKESLDFENFFSYLNKAFKFIKIEEYTKAYYYIFSFNSKKNEFYLYFSKNIFDTNKDYINFILNNINEYDKLDIYFKTDISTFFKLFKNKKFTDNISKIYSETYIVDNFKEYNDDILKILNDKNILNNIKNKDFNKKSLQSLGLSKITFIMGSEYTYNDIDLFKIFKNIDPHKINITENIENYFFVLSYFYINDSLNSDMKKLYEDTFIKPKNLNINNNILKEFFTFFKKEDIIYSHNFFKIFKRFYRYFIRENLFLQVNFFDNLDNPVGFQDKIFQIFFEKSIEFLNKNLSFIENNNTQYNIDVYDENDPISFNYKELLVLTFQYVLYQKSYLQKESFIKVIEKIQNNQNIRLENLHLYFDFFNNSNNKDLKILFFKHFKFKSITSNKVDYIYNMLIFISNIDNFETFKKNYNLKEQYYFFKNIKNNIYKKYNLFLDNISQIQKNYIIETLGVKPDTNTYRSNRFNF